MLRRLPVASLVAMILKKGCKIALFEHYGRPLDMFLLMRVL